MDKYDLLEYIGSFSFGCLASSQAVCVLHFVIQKFNVLTLGFNAIRYPTFVFTVLCTYSCFGYKLDVYKFHLEVWIHIFISVVYCL